MRFSSKSAHQMPMILIIVYLHLLMGFGDAMLDGVSNYLWNGGGHDYGDDQQPEEAREFETVYDGDQQGHPYSRNANAFMDVREGKGLKENAFINVEANQPGEQMEGPKNYRISARGRDANDEAWNLMGGKPDGPENYQIVPRKKEKSASSRRPRPIDQGMITDQNQRATTKSTSSSSGQMEINDNRRHISGPSFNSLSPEATNDIISVDQQRTNSSRRGSSSTGQGMREDNRQLNKSPASFNPDLQMQPTNKYHRQLKAWHPFHPSNSSNPMDQNDGHEIRIEDKTYRIFAGKVEIGEKFENGIEYRTARQNEVMMDIFCDQQELETSIFTDQNGEFERYMEPETVGVIRACPNVYIGFYTIDNLYSKYVEKIFAKVRNPNSLLSFSVELHSHDIQINNRWKEINGHSEKLKIPENNFKVLFADKKVFITKESGQIELQNGQSKNFLASFERISNTFIQKQAEMEQFFGVEPNTYWAPSSAENTDIHPHNRYSSTLLAQAEHNIQNSNVLQQNAKPNQHKIFKGRVQIQIKKDKYRDAKENEVMMEIFCDYKVISKNNFTGPEGEFEINEAIENLSGRVVDIFGAIQNCERSISVAFYIGTSALEQEVLILLKSEQTATNSRVTKCFSKVPNAKEILKFSDPTNHQSTNDSLDGKASDENIFKIDFEKKSVMINNEEGSKIESHYFPTKDISVARYLARNPLVPASSSSNSIPGIKSLKKAAGAITSICRMGKGRAGGV